MYIYIHNVYLYVCVCIYICIYISREWNAWCVLVWMGDKAKVCSACGQFVTNRSEDTRVCEQRESARAAERARERESLATVC